MSTIKRIVSSLVLIALMVLGGGSMAYASPVSLPMPTPLVPQPIYHPKGFQPFVAANNTCNAPSGSRGLWGNTNRNDFVYTLQPNNITAAPPWCINNAGSRLVIQNNGDLTLWNQERSGGSLIWHTAGAANRGAVKFVFQVNDGNIVTYGAGNVALWAAGAWGAGCGTTGWYADSYTNRWTDSQVVSCPNYPGPNPWVRTFQ